MTIPDVKKYLKSLDKDSLDELSLKIGMSDIKKEIIYQHYLYETPLNIICGEVGVSQQSAYKYHNEILKKIEIFLNKKSVKI